MFTPRFADPPMAEPSGVSHQTIFGASEIRPPIGLALPTSGTPEP
jgi:hypothetical protein